MSLLEFAGSPLCVRIVETLAHFLWQGVVMAGLMACVQLLARHSAKWRYRIGFCALLLMAACLPLTFALIPARYVPAPEPVAESSAVTTPEAVESLPAVTSPEAVQPPISVSPPVVDAKPPIVNMPTVPEQPAVVVAEPAAESPIDAWVTAAPYVIVGYGFGVLLMLVRLVLAYGGGERLRRASVPLSDSPLLERLATCAREIGLRTTPAIAQCERLAVPIIVGVFKPTILLPTSILMKLSPAQVEAVLVHELAHIRRWDHLANLLQRGVETVLFFHPAVWYVSRVVSRERENCCDDLVLATGAEPAGYAEMLIRVAELSQTPPQSVAALAATGTRSSRLKERILRVMGERRPSPIRTRRMGPIVFAGLVCTALAAAIYFGRSAAATDPKTADQEKNVGADAGIYRGGFARTGDYGGTGLRNRPHVEELFALRDVVTGGLLIAGETAVFGGAEDQSGQSFVCAVDIASGKQLWRLQTGEPGYQASEPSVVKGRVYFGGMDGHAYCVELRSGKVIWKRKIGHQVYSSPAVLDGRVYFAATGDKSPGKLYALDAATGDVRWSQDGQGTGRITLADSTLFSKDVSSENLAAYDAQTGKEKWRVPFDTGSELVVAGDRLFVSARRRTSDEQFLRWQRDLFAYRASDGKLLWTATGKPEVTYSLDPRHPGSPGIAVGESTVVHTSSGGNVYGVDVNTGRMLWQHTLPDSIMSPPSLHGSCVYVVPHSGAMVAFDVRSGKKLWEQGCDRHHFSAAVIHDDVLYVLGGSGTLFRLTTKPPPGDEVSLQDGSRIQLAGISTSPATDNSWWQADGTRLKRPPFVVRPVVKSSQHHKKYEFAFLFDKLPASADIGRWRCRFQEPGYGSVLVQIRRAKEAGERSELSVSREFLGDPDRTTISLGYASKPRRRVLTVDTNQKILAGDEKWKAAVRQIEVMGYTSVPDGKRTLFQFQRNDRTDFDCTAVAVDKNGREHASLQWPDFGNDNIAIRNIDSARVGSFAFNVPVADVKEIRLESRSIAHDYQWVTFENVSLKPGQSTKPAGREGQATASTATRNEKGRFVSATVRYLDPRDPADSEYHTLTVDDAEAIAELASFFPQAGQDKAGGDATGWTAPLFIDFQQADGSAVKISTDLHQFWSEGRGDWPLKDAVGLAGKVRSIFDEEAKRLVPRWEPAVKFELTHRVEHESAYWNFKSGKHVSWKGHPLNQNAKRTAGVDLYHSSIQSNLDQALALDMDTVEVPGAWKLSALEAIDRLNEARNKKRTKKNTSPSGTFLDAATDYLFETRDGIRGVLHIDPFKDSRQFVHYKLVKLTKREAGELPGKKLSELKARLRAQWGLDGEAQLLHTTSPNGRYQAIYGPQALAIHGYGLTAWDNHIALADADGNVLWTKTLKHSWEVAVSNRGTVALPVWNLMENGRGLAHPAEKDAISLTFIDAAGNTLAEHSVGESVGPNGERRLQGWIFRTIDVIAGAFDPVSDGYYYGTRAEGGVTPELIALDRRGQQRWSVKTEIRPLNVIAADDGKHVILHGGADENGVPFAIYTSEGELTESDRVRHPPGVVQEQPSTVEMVAKSIPLSVWKRLGEDGTVWGKPVSGLRCRWLPLPNAPRVNQPIGIAMKVENTSVRPICWECASEITWAVQQDSDKTNWTMPKFHQQFAGGARLATAAEVNQHFGVGRPGLKGADPFEGYVMVPPGGSVTLSAELPWKYDAVGPYTVRSQLARRNPHSNMLILEKEWLRCPPLVLQVVKQAAVDRTKHSDLTKLHGVWKVVTAEPAGVEFAGKNQKAGDQILIQLIGPSPVEALDRDPLKSVTDHPWLQEQRERWQLVFAVDPLSNPPAFNIAVHDDDAAHPQLGRYRLDGDKLTLRFAAANGKRPAKLALAAGERGGKLSLVRVDLEEDATAKRNADPLEKKRRQLTGTWSGSGFIADRLVLKDDGTFERSYDLPNYGGAKPDSGTWTFDGRSLTFKTTQSDDKQKVGRETVRTVAQLEDGVLKLQIALGRFTTYRRVRVFHGWTLLPKYATTKAEKLPDLFEARPAGSKSYEFRKEVRTVYSGIDGTVYHLPEKNKFYIQSDPIGSSTQTFYGPYTGDPRKLLTLPKAEKKDGTDKTSGETRSELPNTGETGRVVNSAGDGIGGAKLQFVRHESVRDDNGKRRTEFRVLAERVSRADGAFEIPRLPGRKNFVVYVDAEGYYPYDRFHVDVNGMFDQDGRTRILSERGDGLSRVIHMVRPVTLRGRALGPDGKPLGGVPLSISTACRFQHKSIRTANHMRAVSDDDGRFQFDNVPPGEIVLYYPWGGPAGGEVRSGQWKKWTKPGERYPSPPVRGRAWVKVFRAKEAEQIDDIVVDLSKCVCEITGRLTDQHDRPLADMKVTPLWKRDAGWWSVHGMRTVPYVHTDKDGRYRITGMPPGTVHLNASSDHRKTEFKPRPVRLAVGEPAEQNLVVNVTEVKEKTTSKVVPTAGLVVDGKGKPLPGAVIQVCGVEFRRQGKWQPNRRCGFLVPRLKAGPDGRFEFTVDNPESRWNLWIEKDGYATKFVTGVAHGTKSLRVQLDGGTRLMGVVQRRVNGKLAPVGGAAVELRGFDGSQEQLADAYRDPVGFVNGIGGDLPYEQHALTDSFGNYSFRLNKLPKGKSWYVVCLGQAVPLDVRKGIPAQGPEFIVTVEQPAKKTSKSEDPTVEESQPKPSPDNNGAALLWPPKLDKQRLVGLWTRPNSSDKEHIVFLLSDDGSWLHTVVHGPIDDPQSAEHTVRNSSKWELVHAPPRKPLTSPTYSVRLGGEKRTTVNRQSVPIWIPLSRVTATELWNGGANQRYTRADADRGKRLCRLLNVEWKPSLAGDSRHAETVWPGPSSHMQGSHPWLILDAVYSLRFASRQASQAACCIDLASAVVRVSAGQPKSMSMGSVCVRPTGLLPVTAANAQQAFT